MTSSLGSVTESFGMDCRKSGNRSERRELQFQMGEIVPSEGMTRVRKPRVRSAFPGLRREPSVAPRFMLVVLGEVEQSWDRIWAILAVASKQALNVT